MARNLKDMVVVITGASAGIGRTVAEMLARQQARLVLAARRTDRLEALNRSLGGEHLCVGADVSRTEECRELIERSIARFGRIDTLICNAGYGAYRWLADVSPEETREMFATNVFGTTDCVHFALPAMMRQDLRDGSHRGQIMIVSSCVARRGIPVIGTYAATKAAQLAYSEALRVEMKPHRIAVTSVHPVQTKTEFGDVAREIGALDLPASSMGQTVEHVAKRMIAAIRRPAPEVWPSRPSRWVFGLATLFPSVFDVGIGAYRKRVERANVRP